MRERIREDATLTLRIAGENGEGVVSAGELCASMLARASQLVLMHRSAPGADGPATVQLRVGDRPILSIGDSLDILFAWSQDGYDRYRDALWSEGLLLYDPERVRPREADAPIRNGVPLQKLAAVHPIAESKGYVAAGVLARLFRLTHAQGLAAFGHGATEAARAAFDDGYERARRPPLGVLGYELSPWQGPPQAVSTGADAMAGALRKAGVDTAVCLGAAQDTRFASALGRGGMAILGAGDAEEAITLARGAATHERPSILVAPAGLHGLVPLAAALGEAKVLLVRTPREDSPRDEHDLERIAAAGGPTVFAPASVGECAYEATRAVLACSNGRGPVALYLDPVLEDCFASVADRERHLTSYEVMEEALADDEVHPAEGPERHLQLVTGDERGPAGIIAWGAMEGAVREALLTLADRGVRAAHLHLRTLAPIDDGRWRAFLGPLARVIVADPEPSGPVAALLRSRFHVSPVRIDWPQGTPLTPGAVVDAVLRASWSS